MVDVEGKQISNGRHVGRGELLYAKCKKTGTFKCIGRKAEKQEYMAAGGLTVQTIGRKLEHYFGEDRRAIFGYHEIIKPEALEAV